MAHILKNELSYHIVQGLSKAPDAKLIRTEVFVKEQGFKIEFDDIDDFAFHIVVCDGDKPVATGRTFSDSDSDKIYIIGRIAVIKECRGQKLGQLVMEQLEKKAKALGAESILLSAQLHAKGFYEKQGYQAFGETYLDEDCMHIRMAKPINN